MNGAAGKGRQLRWWTALAVVVAVAVLALAPTLAGALAGHATHAGAASSSGLITATTPKCTVGSAPRLPAYDPVSHDTYVPNFGSGTVTVLNQTCNVVGTITLPLGASPESAAFNPANNEVYVSDDSLNAVYALKGLTIAHTITNTLLTDPIDLIFDPGDNMILVTNSYAGFDVVGIIGTNVIGSTPVGSFPGGLCYDPYYNTVLVTNWGSDNVTVLNAYSPLSFPVANVGVGADPEECAYDVTDHLDYVTNEADDNVSVLYGFGAVRTSINVGSLPFGIGWDQNNLRIYVGDAGSGNITEISGFTVVQTIKAGIHGPNGFSFDQLNNKMYVAGWGGSQVFVES